MDIEFEVEMPAHNWTNDSTWRAIIRDWLKDNIGREPGDWTWNIYFPTGDTSYYKLKFKNEEDKVKFILRWL